MKKAGVALICIGIALLAISLVTSAVVTSNEDLKMVEEIFGTEITPSNVESLMELLDMFGDDLLDDMSKLGLQIYTKTPALNAMGILSIASGIALLALEWYRAKHA